MASSIPGQLLAGIKGRKFGSVARLFAPDVHFEGWSNVGHWVADDPQTAARIIEVWFAPGSGSTVTWSNESANARSATLEFEIAWTAPPDEQPRVLRQVYLLTINRAGKIASARVYCPGLHAEFPEVDLEKQRRQKGLSSAPVKPVAAPRATVKAGAE